MDPVTAAVLVSLVPVVGVVLVVVWWRRQEVRGVATPDPRAPGDVVGEGGEPSPGRNPAGDRRRRDARHRGLGLH